MSFRLLRCMLFGFLWKSFKNCLDMTEKEKKNRQHKVFTNKSTVTLFNLKEKKVFKTVSLFDIFVWFSE